MAILALVGAAGGAGTTRLAVETAGRITARGETAVLVDTDFATQGLAEYVPGQFPTDIVGALCDQRPIETVTSPLSVDHTPPPQAAPSFAGLSRVATALETDAAAHLSEELSALTDTYEHVLVDTPMPVTNPAIAAVAAADTVGVVFPRSVRGIESLHRTAGFLNDIDVAAGVQLSNACRQPSPPEDPADIAVPELDRVPPRDAPTTAQGGVGAEAIDTLIEAVTE